MNTIARFVVRNLRFIVLGLVLATAGAAVAANVKCPLHTYSYCNDTYQTSPTGSGAHKWHCTCGDDVWVAR